MSPLGGEKYVGPYICPPPAATCGLMGLEARSELARARDRCRQTGQCRVRLLLTVRRVVYRRDIKAQAYLREGRHALARRIFDGLWSARTLHSGVELR